MKPLLAFLAFLLLNIEQSDAFSVAPPLFRTSTRRETLYSASTDNQESITPTPPSFVNGATDITTSTQAANTTSSSSSFTSSSFVPCVNEPIPSSLLSLPRHSHYGVNEILVKTESTLKALHKHAEIIESTRLITMQDDNTGPCHEKVFANSYVDLGKVDTVGFDYDYTLVTYTEELLELIYDMALNRLVHDRQYPLEMLHSGLKFNPRFSIRGDLDNVVVDEEYPPSS